MLTSNMHFFTAGVNAGCATALLALGDTLAGGLILAAVVLQFAAGWLQNLAEKARREHESDALNDA